MATLSKTMGCIPTPSTIRWKGLSEAPRPQSRQEPKKKNTFREKKLWPGKRKTMLLSFVESGDMKIYDPLAEDLYHEITCFTIGSCSFVDPQKGNFPVPESLKASGVLLEDRARCGSRSAESSRLTDFERVGGKQEATLTDGIYSFISFL